MDTLFIRNYACKTRIGIYEWEKDFPQTILMDLEIGIDAKKIAASDDIRNTYDYDAMTQCINDFLQNKHFNLIETLAEKIADLLMEKFNIAFLKLKLIKCGAMKKPTEVGVIIEKSLEAL